MRQFIVEKQNLKDGLIELIGRDFRYLRQVLRVKKGDMLNVRFDDGELRGTTVAFIDDSAKKITLQVCDFDAAGEGGVTRGTQAGEIKEAFDGRKFVLFQFIPKAQKFELIVRQATECGISVIVPVIGEFSEANCTRMFEGAKRERFERIIKEARQQSGSPVATKIEEPLPLEDAINWWKNFCGGEGDSGAEQDALALALWERTEGEEPLNQLVNNHKNAQNICIAVGNEGGISPSEVKLLKEKGFFSTIHFEGNILRCETAALYGIAAVQSALFQLN